MGFAPWGLLQFHQNAHSDHLKSPNAISNSFLLGLACHLQYMRFDWFNFASILILMQEQLDNSLFTTSCTTSNIINSQWEHKIVMQGYFCTFIINSLQWNWLTRHELDFILIPVWEVYDSILILNVLQDSECQSKKENCIWNLWFSGCENKFNPGAYISSKGSKKSNLRSGFFRTFPKCVSSSQRMMIKW